MPGNDDFPAGPGPSPIATPSPKGAPARSGSGGKSASSEKDTNSVQEGRDRALAAAEAALKESKGKTGTNAAPKSAPKSAPEKPSKPGRQATPKSSSKSPSKAASVKSKAGAAPAPTPTTPAPTPSAKPRRRFAHRDAEPTGRTTQRRPSQDSSESEYAEPGDEASPRSRKASDDGESQYADDPTDDPTAEHSDASDDDQTDDQTQDQREEQAGEEDDTEAGDESEESTQTDGSEDDADGADANEDAAALEARGRALGLTTQDLKRFGADVGQIVEHLEQQNAAKQQATQQQQPEDPFKDIEEDLDPKVLGALRTTFKGLNDTIKTLQAQIHHHAITEAEREFDSAFQNAGETYRPLIGQGLTQELKPKSAELANRAAVIQEVVAIKKVYSQAGMPIPPLRELVRRAIGSLFHDRIEQLARQRLESKVKDRQKKFTSPPTRRKPHAADASPEERARAVAAAKLREFGEETDDSDEF